MLKIGGILNIIIAVAHIIGLFWAEQMFEKTGAVEGMKELAQIHYSIPYLSTIFVAIIFFIFGIYGVLANSKIRKLPLLKLGIFGISFIYLFRGIGEQSYNQIKGTTTTSETIQSIVALIIGLLFLFGGLKKWTLKKRITNAQQSI
ncbi:MAG: hypothetical protein COA88_06575 [Kordia sp.]|nr:MAG: hypothetical protein COA88_06575 [Kordia sp.]